jgi:hypothetical protein
MQCFALPIGMAASAAIILLWIYLTPVTKDPDVNPLLLGAVMLAVFPAHELIHALVHPGYGATRDSIVAAWPSRMLFYAHYAGELTCRRFVAVLGMPLLVISVLPLAISALSGHACVSVAFASAFNALAAGGDLFAIGGLLVQVPPSATVRNFGWRTYYAARH